MLLLRLYGTLVRWTETLLLNRGRLSDRLLNWRWLRRACWLLLLDRKLWTDRLCRLLKLSWLPELLGESLLLLTKCLLGYLLLLGRGLPEWLLCQLRLLSCLPHLLGHRLKRPGRLLLERPLRSLDIKNLAGQLLLARYPELLLLLLLLKRLLERRETLELGQALARQ